MERDLLVPVAREEEAIIPCSPFKEVIAETWSV